MSLYRLDQQMTTVRFEDANTEMYALAGLDGSNDPNCAYSKGNLGEYYMTPAAIDFLKEHDIPCTIGN